MRERHTKLVLIVSLGLRFELNRIPFRLFIVFGFPALTFPEPSGLAQILVLVESLFQVS